MQLHNLKPIHKLKRQKRVGRGGKRGGYSGRGIKGQKSRAGAKIRPQVRDLMMKLPKLRGTRFKSFREKPQILNLDVLEKNFGDGDTVDLSSLVKKNLVKANSKKALKVKILGNGGISKKLIINDILLSAAARAKIEKAGGSVRFTPYHAESPAREGVVRGLKNNV